MTQITLGGHHAKTIGSLPKIGNILPDFNLTSIDLSTKQLKDFKGDKLVLNIFPSVNTGVCASSVRKFNEKASSLNNTKVLCISKDLPFSQDQFCAAEGLENVVMLSDFKTGEFGETYGTTIISGAFEGLHSRCIIVTDENHKVIYTEQVIEIGHEPNYDAAIKHL
ncbi:MAG: thiol peroxidase [Winogradskyella sp.]|nr:thiol peroxidase [Winogradskyella sp.]